MRAALRQPEWEQKWPVAVEARLLDGEGTGVASYGRVLVAALGGAGVEVLRVADRSSGRFGAASGPVESAVRWMRARAPGAPVLERRGDELWHPDVFRRALVRFRVTGRVLRLRVPGPPGVMHWIYPIPAVVEGWVNVHTVHDVIPLTDPALSPVDGADLARRIRACAAAGDAVVTVSEHARAAIVATLGLDPARVVDCGGAVVGLEPGQLPPGLERGRFLLACGLVEPRKNLDRLADAWVAAGRPMPLLVVGPDGAGGAAIRGRIAAAGVEVLPFQPRPVLAALIAGARALLMPSLAEGFGLPAAEAMACGTPVLASAGGALEEVAGAAALLVDPLDTNEIAAGIRALAGDDALAARLSAAGRGRAGRFTPAAFADRLLPLYRRLVAERGGVA
jgi:glycosyltransferase involved in cell wall biosynthesis